ncbi:hypothetical protein K1719_037773 [Acacia pycnantha]|nr:hypothetical protein K1719_037773 [Acacia pycnantha]
MGIENRTGADRAWKILRLALLWARKGGVFKRRLVTEMRLLPKYFKRLTHTAPPSHIYYLERELSFDKTPMFNRPSSMRFHLPHIPCINPHVHFEYDRDYDLCYDNTQDDDEQCRYRECEQDNNDEDQGIDVRAEEFIAKFYQQMKLQRQISLLRYNETPTRLSC